MREFGSDCGILYIEKPEEAVEVAANLRDEDVQRLKMQAKQFIENYDWDKLAARFEATLTSLVENSHQAATYSTRHSKRLFRPNRELHERNVRFLTALNARPSSYIRRPICPP